MGNPYLSKESASLLTRDPVPEAISLAEATDDTVAGSTKEGVLVGVVKGVAQRVAATKADVTALDPVANQSELSSDVADKAVVTVLEAGATCENASTVGEPVKSIQDARATMLDCLESMVV